MISADGFSLLPVEIHRLVVNTVTFSSHRRSSDLFYWFGVISFYLISQRSILRMRDELTEICWLCSQSNINVVHRFVFRVREHRTLSYANEFDLFDSIHSCPSSPPHYFNRSVNFFFFLFLSFFDIRAGSEKQRQTRSGILVRSTRYEHTHIRPNVISAHDRSSLV